MAGTEWTPARILELRLSRGETQAEFATAMRLTGGKGTVSQWERGTHKPTGTAAIRLGLLDRAAKEGSQI